MEQQYTEALSLGLVHDTQTPAFKVVNNLDEESWRQFVSQHPQGNVFHTPEMFKVFARSKGHRPTIWASIRKDGQVLALFLPVQVTLNGLLSQLTTRAISYGSVLNSDTNQNRHAFSSLLKDYVNKTRGTYLFTELRNISDLDDVQPILNEQGFVYEKHLNYLIDLNLPVEVIFQNIGGRTRKNIRHGLNRGEVVIKEITEREEIGACYGLLQSTYQAAAVPLADRTLFESAFDLLYPKGMVRFTMAYVGQKPAATSVELLYKDVMYGWYGGMDRAFSSYVPNELLMWHILKWGAENGYQVYDFGGAGKPDEEYKVRDFKAKFGGKLVCFGRNICVHSPVKLWFSKRGYQILRRWL